MGGGGLSGRGRRTLMRLFGKRNGALIRYSVVAAAVVAVATAAATAIGVAVTVVAVTAAASGKSISPVAG